MREKKERKASRLERGKQLDQECSVQPLLHTEFEASRCYMKRSLKKDRNMKTSKRQTSVFFSKAKATSTINAAFCSFPPSVGKKLMQGFCQFIPGLKSTPEEKNKTKPTSHISIHAQPRQDAVEACTSRITRLRRYNFKNLT